VILFLLIDPLGELLTLIPMTYSYLISTSTIASYTTKMKSY